MRKNRHSKKRDSKQIVDLNSQLKKLQTAFLDPNIINWMVRGGAKGVRERLLKIDYSVLRNIVDRVPLLNAIIKTRINQVLGFTRYVTEDQAREGEKGFRLVATEEEGGKADPEEIKLLVKFIKQTGYDYSSEREDDFSDYLQMIVRETCTIDQIATEIQYNLRGQPAAYWVVDGATLKRTTPEYPKKNVAFIQVLDDVIKEEYNHNNLVFDYKNKRADVRFRGYGYSDVEMAIDLITTLLFGYNHLRDQFVRDKMPRGFISVMGDIDTKGLTAIQQYWYSAMSGAGGQWAIPILPSGKDGVGIDFKAIGTSNKDMEYHKGMMFVSSLIAAVFSIDLAELGIKADDATHVFGANEMTPRVEASKDRGLDSLLMFMEQHLNKVLRKVTTKYELKFSGVDPVDQLRKTEILTKRLGVDMTINEILEKQGKEKMDRPYADEILNQFTVQLLIQDKQAQQAQEGMMGGSPGEGSEGEDMDFPEIGEGESLLEGEESKKSMQGDWKSWDDYVKEFDRLTRRKEKVMGDVT